MPSPPQADTARQSSPHLVGGGGYVVLLVALVIGLVAALIAGISIGTVTLPISDIWSVVGHHLGVVSDAPSKVQDQIVWEFRTPRVLLAAVVGAALSVAGACLQVLARNGLADPYVLGVSSGASLGAVVVLAYGSGVVGGLGVTGAAFVAATLTLFVVYVLAQRSGRVGPSRLVLAGVAVSYLATAGTSFIQLYSRPSEVRGLMFWILGSFASASWDDLGIPTVVITVTSTWLLVRARSLNVMSTGDDSAAALGVDVNRFRIELLLISSILTAGAVSVAGGIGFVGLMVPHACRFIVGPDHRRLLPVAVLTGRHVHGARRPARQSRRPTQRAPGRHLHRRHRGTVLPHTHAPLRSRPMNVTLDGVTVTIDGNDIIGDVSIEIRTGEMHGIVGPNGSGKSTLLRCLYRALRPAKGRALIDGDDIWRQLSARQAAQRRAIVPQDSTVDFDFSVRETVAMGRAPHQRLLDRDNLADTEIIDGALTTVGMTTFASRLVSTLSGGERQRVLLARALAQQAPVLVLDEPTNHLDIRAQLELLELVHSLPTTTIAALHDLDHAASLCDTVTVLDHGTVVDSGPPHTVLTPELIHTVFGVYAHIGTHPLTGRPHITVATTKHSIPATDKRTIDT